MKSITLENWSTHEVLQFSCLNWEIENYQYVFYCDEDKKIIERCFSTRYWDIRLIEQ